MESKRILKIINNLIKLDQEYLQKIYDNLVINDKCFYQEMQKLNNIARWFSEKTADIADAIDEKI